MENWTYQILRLIIMPVQGEMNRSMEPMRVYKIDLNIYETL